MKLNDIIRSYNWLSIELTLIRLYPGQETIVDYYRYVFEKLKFLVPVESDMSIIMTYLPKSNQFVSITSNLELHFTQVLKNNVNLLQNIK